MVRFFCRVCKKVKRSRRIPSDLIRTNYSILRPQDRIVVCRKCEWKAAQNRMAK